jgi:hypothetical protein
MAVLDIADCFPCKQRVKIAQIRRLKMAHFGSNSPR